ncbi:11590_t:CDS:2, partial [Gigaspora rosea]
QIKGALLEKAASNQQTTFLLADINQKFEIITNSLPQCLSFGISDI